MGPEQNQYMSLIRSGYWLRSSRSGAVIVLVAVLLVVLLGFTVLAVDVGYMYNTRAELQNAADAAAMAAAVAMGADFLLYGPVEDAKIVFPAVAMIDTSLSQLAIERGTRPEKSHPRFRIG